VALFGVSIVQIVHFAIGVCDMGFLDTPGITIPDAKDILEKRKADIIDRIWAIGDKGKPSDSVKLKAWTTLLNKSMPDKFEHTVAVTINSNIDFEVKKKE
jgi:hypothetical protein